MSSTKFCSGWSYPLYLLRIALAIEGHAATTLKVGTSGTSWVPLHLVDHQNKLPEWSQVLILTSKPFESPFQWCEALSSKFWKCCPSGKSDVLTTLGTEFTIFKVLITSVLERAIVYASPPATGNGELPDPGRTGFKRSEIFATLSLPSKHRWFFSSRALRVPYTSFWFAVAHVESRVSCSRRVFDLPAKGVQTHPL